MKLLSCLRAPDAKRVLPPATVVASRSSPLTCEAGAAPRQLSLGGQVDGGSLAPDHLSVPFLKNGSRCSWADLDSSSDDRLVAATVRCDSHHQQRFERKGTSWPWVYVCMYRTPAERVAQDTEHASHLGTTRPIRKVLEHL